MSTEPLKLIDAVAAAIAGHADELTALDRAIGDGDHGTNMKRGFDAVAAIRGELEPLGLDELLQKVGVTLVMKVGGASGPLYGSLFMSMGKSLGPSPDTSALSAAFAAGVDAVKQRGKSDVGEKTMLDVLCPVAEALAVAVAAGTDLTATCARLRTVASDGVEATRDMRATKGRASYLGERSVGHLDPGAVSSRLMIDAVCERLEASL